MDHALIAIDKDQIAVQRLGRDGPGMDHQRDRQRAGHDGGMAADRSLLQHHALEAAAIVEQFRRSDIARDQHRIGGKLGARVAALTRQAAQQPVGQVIQIMQPVAQIGVRHRFHPRPRAGLFFFHRRLGREAARDVLLHPAHPAARMGKHPVRFQHLALFALGQGRARQHVVDIEAQQIHRRVQPDQFRLGVVGDKARDDHARLMQPDPAHRRALLRTGTAEHHLLFVAFGHSRVLVDKGAKLGHLGQNHGHDLEPVDLVAGIFACIARLHHQHAQPLAQALDRHAKEAGIAFLAGFGHVAKAAFGGGIGGVDRLGRARDAPHQPFTHAHAGDMDRFGRKPLGRAQLQRIGIAQ